jgi:hypothetical protein
MYTPPEPVSPPCPTMTTNSSIISSMMNSVIKGYQETIVNIMDKFDNIQKDHSSHLLQQQQMFMQQMNQQNEFFYKHIDNQMTQHRELLLRHKNNTTTQEAPTTTLQQNPCPAPIAPPNDDVPPIPGTTACETEVHKETSKSKKKKKQNANKPNKNTSVANPTASQVTASQVPTTPSKVQQINTPALQSPRKSPRKVDSMILGDSITKHIKGGKIKRDSGRYSKIRSYPGAGVEQMADHAEVELKYVAPEIVILHGGTTGLSNNMSPNEISDILAYLAEELKARGVKKVAVSSLTPRYRMKDEIAAANDILKDMCHDYRLDFIDNSNISYFDHISDDGIHLLRTE